MKLSRHVTTGNRDEYICFYINDIAAQVYEKGVCTCLLENEMKVAGFCKVPFETLAGNEAEATDKMFKYHKDNDDMLRGFAKDHAISSAVFLSILVNTPDL